MKGVARHMNALADGMGMGMGDMCSMGMVWMLVMGLVGLALLALAVLGAVWIVQRSRPSDQGGGHPETPEDVLRRRYAAGELDEDEYLQRRAGLKND